MRKYLHKRHKFRCPKNNQIKDIDTVLPPFFLINTTMIAFI